MTLSRRGLPGVEKGSCIRWCLGMTVLGLAALLSASCQHNHSEFYPIGIYAVNSTNDFPTVRSVGFNVVTTILDGPHLSQAQAHRLKVLAILEQPLGSALMQSRPEALSPRLTGTLPYGLGI
jgi:hypothetical protein